MAYYVDKGTYSSSTCSVSTSSLEGNLINGGAALYVRDTFDPDPIPESCNQADNQMSTEQAALT